MKVFVFLAVLVAMASAEWHRQTYEDINGYRSQCGASLNIPDEILAEYKKWNFTDDNQTHCYIKCIFTHMGLFDDEHGFHVEHLVEQLGHNAENKEEIREKVNFCIENKMENCSYAFKGFACLRKYNLSLIQASLKTE